MLHLACRDYSANSSDMRLDEKTQPRSIMDTVTTHHPSRTSPAAAPAGQPHAVPADSGVHVVSACTIRRPASELYAFWRNLENITAVVKHPISITRTSAGESHWSVSAPPGNRRVEWDATIVLDQPDEAIGWQAREGAEIPNSGSIRFQPAPGDEGTEVRVDLRYEPPGGKLGAWLAKVSGEEGAQQVVEALRRFKALMEAGEIPTTAGQPVGEPQRSKKQKKGKS